MTPQDAQAIVAQLERIRAGLVMVYGALLVIGVFTLAGFLWTVFHK